MEEQGEQTVLFERLEEALEFLKNDELDVGGDKSLLNAITFMLARIKLKGMQDNGTKMDGPDGKCLPAGDIGCVATVWIYRTLPTTLVVIGTFGNIINMFVFSRRRLRASPCFLLAFLGFFDTIQLWSAYMLRPLRLGFGIDITGFSENLCKVYAWVIPWSASASLWIVAIFTVERLLFTIVPHQTKLHLNRNKSLALIAVAVLAIGTLLGIMWYLMWSGLMVSNIEPRVANETACSMLKTDVELVWHIWVLVPCYVLPCLIIIPGNITLGVKLYKLRRAGTNLDAQTIMLLLVTALMIITLALFGVVSLMLSILQKNEIVRSHATHFIRAVFFTFAMGTNSLNVAMYSWKGTLFKRECNEILKDMKKYACTCECKSNSNTLP